MNFIVIWLAAVASVASVAVRLVRRARDTPIDIEPPVTRVVTTVEIPVVIEVPAIAPVVEVPVEVKKTRKPRVKKVAAISTASNPTKRPSKKKPSTPAVD